jgi:hypothetical protein
MLCAPLLFAPGVRSVLASGLSTQRRSGGARRWPSPSSRRSCRWGRSGTAGSRAPRPSRRRGRRRQTGASRQTVCTPAAVSRVSAAHNGQTQQGACLLGVAQRLHQLLHRHRLAVREREALSRHARRVDKDVGVGRDARHRTRHVLVQLVHLLRRLGRLEQLRRRGLGLSVAKARCDGAARKSAVQAPASGAAWRHVAL